MVGGRRAANNFVITPHKRRGPIAAEFQPPAPNSYNTAGLTARGEEFVIICLSRHLLLGCVKAL